MGEVSHGTGTTFEYAPQREELSQVARYTRGGQCGDFKLYLRALPTRVSGSAPIVEDYTRHARLARACDRLAVGVGHVLVDAPGDL